MLASADDAVSLDTVASVATVSSSAPCRHRCFAARLVEISSLVVEPFPLFASAGFERRRR